MVKWKSTEVTEVNQELTITNNNLLFLSSCHNNDLLVLKKWKGTSIKSKNALSPLPSTTRSVIILKNIRLGSC